MQKTAYDVRISDWSSDVCSSDLERGIAYTDNLLMSYHSKVLIDVHHGEHQGLSFRVFEALSFGKKLITTNQQIRRYDFYHPNNISIWGNHTMDELEAFLAAPVIPALPHVLEKDRKSTRLNSSH